LEIYDFLDVLTEPVTCEVLQLCRSTLKTLKIERSEAPAQQEQLDSLDAMIQSMDSLEQVMLQNVSSVQVLAGKSLEPANRGTRGNIMIVPRRDPEFKLESAWLGLLETTRWANIGIHFTFYGSVPNDAHDIASQAIVIAKRRGINLKLSLGRHQDSWQCVQGLEHYYTTSP
jgi:hypothetical protein